MVRNVFAPKAKPGKGGNRNYKKTINIDMDHLTDEIKWYVKAVGCKAAFDFGEYNNILGACAVRGFSGSRCGS